MFYCLVLRVEQQGRVAANDLSGAVGKHAPAEIPVAGADVEYALAVQIHVRRDAVPLPVRAPLGVDANTTQVEGSLAPGNELPQGFGQGFGIFRRFPGDQDAVLDVPAGFDFRQCVDCSLPFREIAVAAGFECFVAAGFEEGGGLWVEEGEELGHGLVGWLVGWLAGWLVVGSAFGFTLYG